MKYTINYRKDLFEKRYSKKNKLLEEAAMNRHPCWDGYNEDGSMSFGPVDFHVLQIVTIIDNLFII